ncbi:MAG: hypothetical protein H5T70_02340, partial [Chloroflexi bacterium]|nr:hypothetical protein [Chloroflexota bacterium]
YDETVNAYFASRPWGEIWEWCTRIDNQALLGFVLLKGWSGLVGDSEFALRAFSVCCALLAAAGLIALGRRVGGRWSAGLLAGSAFVLSQSFLYAAFEARPYALALALFAWSNVFFWELWERYGLGNRPLDRRYGLILGGYLALTLAMCYTHYTGLVLAALAQGAYALLTLWMRPPRRALHVASHMTMGLILGYTPWLIALAGRDIRGGTAFEGMVPIGYALRAYLAFWMHGQREVPPEALRYGWGMIALVLLAPILWAVGGGKRAWHRVLFALLITGVPLLLLLVLVHGFHGKLAGRHGWPAWLGAALLIGLGLSTLERLRWGRWPLWAAALALIWLPAQANLKPSYDSRLREAFAYIRANAQPGDALVLRDGSLFTAAGYYQVGLPWVGLPDVKLIDTRHVLTVEEALDTLEAFLEATGAERLWVLSWQAYIMDRTDVGLGVLEYLGSSQSIEGSFGDVKLALYRLRNTPQALRARLAEGIPRLIAPGGPAFLGGYINNRGPIHPRTKVVLHTWWVRAEPTIPDLRVSFRVYDAEGHFYTQSDLPPGGWLYGLDEWPPNTPIFTRAVLRVPEDLPPGEYTIGMVVYNASNTFAPVFVCLTPFTVEPRAP